VSIELVRLDHVNLGVSDLATSKRFYGELLGLKEAARPADMKRDGAWYLLGEVQLHLSVETSADNHASKRHVAFQVRSVAEARAAFTSAGVSYEEGHPLPGIQRIFARDPSGNRVELYENLG
jgi:catechol 2,3-dioxygenase-like lactoylglutathione lyase family enzyme